MSGLTHRAVCLSWLVAITSCKAYDANLLMQPRANGESADSAGHQADGCGAHLDRCNGEDDDCDGIVDEDGTLGCALPNAQMRCVGGACVLLSCTTGYFNCNGSAADGCEASLADVACGQCGRECGTQSMVDAQVQTAHPEAGPATQRDDAGDPHGGDLDEDASTCAVEHCDGMDNDCDGRIDEDGACACEDAAPTGRGRACDLCACERCGADLGACLATSDPQWNSRCGALIKCYGMNLVAGNCPNGDCTQNGRGPCAMQVQEADNPADCVSSPARSPCGAATLLGARCFDTTCAADCKP